MKISNYVVVIAISAGCGKKQPAEPFAGPLDIARVMASKDLVHPFDPWDEGLAKLEAQLGKPTKVDGNHYKWAVMVGDDCAYTDVEKADGKEYKKEGWMVGAVQSPMTLGKDAAMFNRAECLELVGKGVPEDPNAPGPAADGAPMPIAFVLKNAVPGRAKWDGKSVKVAAVMNSSSNKSAFLYDAADTSHANSLECDGDTVPSADLIGKPVVATGTVKLQKAAKGDGTPAMDVELVQCSVAAAAGGGSAAAGSAATGSAAAAGSGSAH